MVLSTGCRNLCSGTCSTFSPSSFSDLGVHRAVSHLVFFCLFVSFWFVLFLLSFHHFSLLCGIFSPFLSFFPSWQLSSDMPCGVVIGAGWNLLCLAPGTSGLFSRRNPASYHCQQLSTYTQSKGLGGKHNI